MRSTPLIFFSMVGWFLPFPNLPTLQGAELSKPQPPIRLEVSTPGESVPGGPVTALLEIEVNSPGASIRVRAEGQGTLAAAAVDTVLSGPWSPGQHARYELSTPPAGAGAGTIHLRCELLDAANLARHAAVGEVFAETDGEDTWTSGSSPTDVKLRRLAGLQGRGRITPAEYEAGMEEVRRGSVVVDHTPRHGRSMNGHELRMQRRFESFLTNELVAAAATGDIVAAAATITVQGHVDWTDRAGAVHGLPLATVEIWDEDLLTTELIGTTMTDAAGNYSLIFTFDDGLLQGDPDIFVRVYARSPVADIKPDSAGAGTYFKQSTTTAEVPPGTHTVNFTIGNVNDDDTVYSLHHALVMIGGYAGSLAGATPSQVDTRFPTTRSTSLFNGTQLHILRLDRWDWDVIHHEYGHYLMSIAGFQNNPGGSHSFGDNLAVVRGSKDIGTRLAWGEGWPTFFAISGQNAMAAGTLGIPNVGDTAYQDTEDSTANLDLETSNGLGEDNEVSTMAALWDLYDNPSDRDDKLALSDRELFSTLRTSGATTAGAAWEALAAGQDTRGKTLLGGVFGQAKIAPQLLAPVENASLSGSTPPVFMWARNGGGAANPLNDFRIRFYKNDFSSVVFEKELGDVDTFTPDSAAWAAIRAGDAVVKWVVEGQNTSAPSSPGGSLGHYWSAARSLGAIKIIFVIDDTGSMSEEIDGVRTALQTFIDQVEARLPAGAEPPTIQLVTFKDSVNPRIVTKDLNALRTVVASLTADGGGDCPEFGAQALEFAAENIARNGTILFATDASSQPGVDLSAVISKLRTKGVSVNTILSGDCFGIPAGAFVGAGSEADSGQKPGQDDLPQGPITDPGQLPIDVHGNTPEAATPLPADGTRMLGVVGVAGDAVDYFRVSLEAGHVYSMLFRVESGSVLPTVFTLFAPDGVGVLRSRSVGNSLPTQFTFQPGASSNYFIAVSRPIPDVAATYSLSVKEDPFAELVTAVEMFSTISAQSGGVFLLRDGVNRGQDTEYAAALFNVMASTLGPVVLAADPTLLQQGTTLTVSLRGRNTNWRPGSTVTFSSPGITVESVDVRSATALAALVTVDPAATPGFQEVTVRTALGAETEVATGMNVAEVVPQSPVPAILSVEPDEVSQGEHRTILVRGVNTAWTSNSIVIIGADVSVESTVAVSSNLVEAVVSVPLNARIGFYTASVATPGGTTETKSRALFVNTQTLGVPQIASLSPNEGQRGQTLTVELVGLNTHFADGLSSAAFGPGVNVLSVQVLNPTNARVRLAIASDAAPGFRDASLVTGSESVVLLQGFFIIPGPAGILPSKLQVLAELTELRAAVDDPQEGGKLDQAIRHLTDSTDPSLWLDANHLAPRGGREVFNQEKDAVDKLRLLLDPTQTSITATTALAFIERLLQLDRSLASIGIEEAQTTGASSNRLALAREQLAAGDEDIADTRYLSGIEHYRNAWQHVLRPRITSLASLDTGRTRIEFFGFPNASYVLQTSSDLITWTTLDRKAAGTDGSAVWEDLVAAGDGEGGGTRFYRVLLP